MFFDFKDICNTLNSWIGELENSFFDVTNRFTANVLSAEIADECLQTKSKDNLQ